MNAPLIIGDVFSKRVYNIEIFKGSNIIGHAVWHDELKSWLFRAKDSIGLQPETLINIAHQLRLQTIETLKVIVQQEETEYALATGPVKKGKKKS